MLRKNIPYRFVLTVILVASFYLQPFAQGWDVPADKKAKNSYIKFDKATAKEGETVYTKNCQSCHGDIGKNNSLKSLKPIPPDLSSTKSQQLTDGELFYILNTGRMIMPSFNNVLSETDRWKVISYIRSFNNSYIQVLSKTDPTKSNLVKINLSYDSINSIVRVQVTASEKAGVVALKNSEIILFANRYFGKLQIDKTLRTDNDGIALFRFTKNLPGDKSGNVELIVKVNDDKYGEILSQSKLKIGVPTDKPSLTEKRAIWNVLLKAPIWLIITYTSGVLIFGVFLLFLLYGLFRIKKSGNN
jgi:mono/diheme cytochrome c family protein